MSNVCLHFFRWQITCILIKHIIPYYFVLFYWDVLEKPVSVIWCICARLWFINNTQNLNHGFLVKYFFLVSAHTGTEQWVETKRQVHTTLNCIVNLSIVITKWLYTINCKHMDTLFWGISKRVLLKPLALLIT